MNIMKAKRLTEQIPILFRQPVWVRSLILGLLILMLVVGTVPGYLAGRWSWSDQPKIANPQYLTHLRESGLEVPGWQTLEQAIVQVGSKKWSAQLSQKNGGTSFFLMLLPQVYYLDQPMTEWIDIKGLEKWKTNNGETLSFSAQNLGSEAVKAKLFRAWKTDTFAVVQWYSWLHGGSAYSSDWFWKDQAAQKRGQRLPWVAVSLKVPIDPLGDFQSYRPQLTELAQAVQSALDAKVFEPMLLSNS
jgi:cyanoexosortase B-associated protein